MKRFLWAIALLISAYIPAMSQNVETLPGFYTTVSTVTIVDGSTYDVTCGVISHPTQAYNGLDLQVGDVLYSRPTSVGDDCNRFIVDSIIYQFAGEVKVRVLDEDSQGIPATGINAFIRENASGIPHWISDIGSPLNQCISGRQGALSGTGGGYTFYTQDTSGAVTQVVSGDTVQLSGGGGSILDTDDQTIDQAELIGDSLYLSLEDDGESAKIVDLSAYKDNTDAQNLSDGGKAGTTQTINITNGTSVSFSVADNDNNPANEYNTSLNLSGTILQLTDGGGTLQRDLSGLQDGFEANTDDQAITRFEISGDTLYLDLEDGGSATVLLDAYLDDTDTVFDGDSSVTNEIQTLSDGGMTGTMQKLNLSKGGGMVTFDVADNDNDSSNELNATLAIENDTLKITDSGGTLAVSLAAYLDNVDTDTDEQFFSHSTPVAGTERITISGSNDFFDLAAGANMTITRTDSTITFAAEVADVIDTTYSSNDTLFFVISGDTTSVVISDSDDQNLSDGGRVGNVQTVNITDGNSVSFSVADPDSSITNELQDLGDGGKVGNNQTITISDGVNVTFSVADADSSSTNEIQNLFNRVFVDADNLTGGIKATGTAAGRTAGNETDQLIFYEGALIDLYYNAAAAMQMQIDVDTTGLKTFISENSASADTDKQQIDSLYLSGTTLYISLQRDSIPALGIDLTSLQDGTGTDDQAIDSFQIISNTLFLSLESDGEAAKQVDLLPYLDNTDAQGFTQFEITNDTIFVTLSGDAGGQVLVDLSPYLDDTRLRVENQDSEVVADADAIDFSDNFSTTNTGTEVNVQLSNTGVIPNTYGNATNVAQIVIDAKGRITSATNVPITDNDTQLTQEQVQDFVGTMFSGSETLITVLYDDNGNVVTFEVNDDLSQYDNSTSQFLQSEIDGDTLNEIQDLNLSGNTLSLTNDPNTGSFSLLPYLDNTDDQVLDTLELVGTTLRISISGDGVPFETVDLSSLQDGTGTDNQNLQNGSFNTGNGELTIGIENGNSDVIGLDGRYLKDEVDGDTLNEIQSLSWEGGTRVLTLDNGGGSVTITDSEGTDDQNLLNGSFDTGTGVLTMNIEGGSSGTVDLDGRYIQEEIDDNVTNEAWVVSDGTNSELVDSDSIFFEGAGNVTTSYNPTTNIMTINSTGGIDTSYVINDSVYIVSGEDVILTGVLPDQAGYAEVRGSQIITSGPFPIDSNLHLVQGMAAGDLRNFTFVNDKLIYTGDTAKFLVNLVYDPLHNFTGLYYDYWLLEIEAFSKTKMGLYVNGNVFDQRSWFNTAGEQYIYPGKQLFSIVTLATGDSVGIAASRTYNVADSSLYVENAQLVLTQIDNITSGSGGGGGGAPQTLSYNASNQDLSISGGNTVDLSGLLDNTDEQDLSDGGKTGNNQTIDISGGGNSVTFSVADADSSITNEIQDVWDFVGVRDQKMLAKNKAPTGSFQGTTPDSPTDQILFYEDWLVDLYYKTISANSMEIAIGVDSNLLKTFITENVELGTDSVLTEQQVKDYVGEMVTGNTESGIEVTYTGGVLNFNVTESGTDSQTIDSLDLDGTDLVISLQNDGEVPLKLDLSPLQDGVGTTYTENEGVDIDGTEISLGHETREAADVAAIGDFNGGDVTKVRYIGVNDASGGDYLSILDSENASGTFGNEYPFRIWSTSATNGVNPSTFYTGMEFAQSVDSGVDGDYSDDTEIMAARLRLSSTTNVSGGFGSGAFQILSEDAIHIIPTGSLELQNIPADDGNNNTKVLTLNGDVVEYRTASSLAGGSSDADSLVSAVISNDSLVLELISGELISVDLAAFLDNTDNQTIDSLGLDGTELVISIERDGENPLKIDLSVLQDGTGTDNQGVDNFSLSGNVLTLEVENDGQTAHTATFTGWDTNASDDYTSSDFDTDFALQTTDGLTEGSSNLYDKTVTVTETNGIKVTGAYPNFGIGIDTLTATDNYVLKFEAGTGPVWAIDETGAPGTSDGVVSSASYSDSTLTLTRTESLGNLTAKIPLPDVTADGVTGVDFNSLTFGASDFDNTGTTDNPVIEVNFPVNNDNDSSNELQDFDVAELSGTTLRLSLSQDADVSEIPLSVLQDGTGTDNQGLFVSGTAAPAIQADNNANNVRFIEGEGLNFTGNETSDEITLEYNLVTLDGQMTENNIENQDRFLVFDNDGDVDTDKHTYMYAQDLKDYVADGTGTDDQTVDEFYLDSNNFLAISLENDGEDTVRVDLSPLASSVDAENGLTKTSNTIKLGGVLTEATQIDLYNSTDVTSYPFILNHDDGTNGDSLFYTDTGEFWIKANDKATDQRSYFTLGKDGANINMYRGPDNTYGNELYFNMQGRTIGLNNVNGDTTARLNIESELGAMTEVSIVGVGNVGVGSRVITDQNPEVIIRTRDVNDNNATEGALLQLQNTIGAGNGASEFTPYTFPTTAGTGGEILLTNNSGDLVFVDTTGLFGGGGSDGNGNFSVSNQNGTYAVDTVNLKSDVSLVNVANSNEDIYFQLIGEGSSTPQNFDMERGFRAFVEHTADNATSEIVIDATATDSQFGSNDGRIIHTSNGNGDLVLQSVTGGVEIRSNSNKDITIIHPSGTGRIDFGTNSSIDNASSVTSLMGLNTLAQLEEFVSPGGGELLISTLTGWTSIDTTGLFGGSSDTDSLVNLSLIGDTLQAQLESGQLVKVGLNPLFDPFIGDNETILVIGQTGGPYTNLVQGDTLLIDDSNTDEQTISITAEPDPLLGIQNGNNIEFIGSTGIDVTGENNPSNTVTITNTLPEATTASQGLTEVGSDIQLGGTLSQVADIALADITEDYVLISSSDELSVAPGRQLRIKNSFVGDHSVLNYSEASVELLAESDELTDINRQNYLRIGTRVYDDATATGRYASYLTGDGNFEISGDTLVLEANEKVEVAGDAALRIIGGTTGNRPAGENGMLYWNTTTTTLQVYDGTAWRDLADQFTDGTTIDFTLTNGTLTAEIEQAEETVRDVTIDGTFSSSESVNLGGYGGGIFEFDVSAITTSTVTLSNPVNGGTYAFRFHSGSSTCAVSFSGGTFKSLDDSSLDPVSIPAGEGKLITMYYNGTEYIVTNE
jgi:hypothetical protein